MSWDDAATVRRRIELRGRLAHWSERLPAHGMFTGLTACEFWGLWTPPRPTGPLDVAVPASARGSRQAAFSVTRVAALPGPWMVGSVPVATVEEAVLAAMDELGLLDAVVLVDAVLALRPDSARALGRHAALRRRGAPLLRRALSYADDRSESPWETILRMLHGVLDVSVTPQVDVHDASGLVIGRADLLIDGTRTLQEYDGAGHREPAQYRDDRRRDAALAAAGYVRHGWTAPDLTRDFDRVARAADIALRRRGDPARLARWSSLLSDSWFGSRKVARNVT